MKLIRSLSTIFFVLAATACTPTQGQQAKDVTKTGFDLGSAVCTQLEKQPEPAWVTFTCDAVTIGDGVAHTFLARVPAALAPAFASQTCSAKTGKVSP